MYGRVSVPAPFSLTTRGVLLAIKGARTVANPYTAPFYSLTFKTARNAS